MTATATPTAVRKFKLLVGQHYERNADEKNRRSANAVVKHVAPCIVESSRLLDEIYVNKFEKVLRDDGEPVVVTDARKGQVSVLLTQGWKEEDRSFLENLADADFQRVQRMALPRPGQDSGKISSPLGDDVTDGFQRAYDEGFKVFRNATGKHQVTRGASGKPLNPKPLERSEVEPFVERYLKEQK